MAPPLADILHRGAVLTLVGISVWGIGTGVMVHRDTLRRGREMLAQREADGLPNEDPVKQEHQEEINEQTWAEAAQVVLKGRGPNASSSP
ncbi:hypothetical protein HETIRDRAFT_125346 [Heterobasidion irregulare TC 32-1]|uniref:Uncharacterized protein n=1 Tax=Heterobasidion irregulare (strain TC 32-1) TaxID=747525 RepID=W4JVM1_HETIT|nr:uncharacterized protein HETIRDRAFT_125346 [Heterobasidion irregulare TC 32-1]ETW77618.1 hypothetical protein HETIRDRAFT_125346 [Heterobasidion irregulare TC 32-1]